MVLFVILNIYYVVINIFDKNFLAGFIRTNNETIKEIIINIYSFTAGGIIGRVVIDYFKAE